MFFWFLKKLKNHQDEWRKKRGDMRRLLITSDGDVDDVDDDDDDDDDHDDDDDDDDDDCAQDI